MLSCIPCPSQANGQEGEPVFPSTSSLGYRPSVTVKWGFRSHPPFLRQRSGPLPLEQTLLLGPTCFFACLYPTFDTIHVSATFPLQVAIWRVGDLLPTVTGLWGSDYLA